VGFPYRISSAATSILSERRPQQEVVAPAWREVRTSRRPRPDWTSDGENGGTHGTRAPEDGRGRPVPGLTSRPRVGRVSGEGRGDHHERRQAGGGDQEGRERGPDVLHGLFGFRFQDQVGQDRLDRERPAVPGRDVRRQAAGGPLESRRREARSRAGGRHAAAVAKRLRSSALRTIVLVPLRCGLRLRLQHDAGELRETAHARRHALLSRPGEPRHPARQCLQELPGECPGDEALGRRQRLQAPPGPELVRQHGAGIPEQRRAAAEAAHNPRRRRRAIPAAHLFAVPGARCRPSVEQRDVHGSRGALQELRRGVSRHRVHDREAEVR